MPWRCARQTSSCRNRAWDSLETVPCCNKSTCTETLGCHRTRHTGQGCSKRDLSLLARGQLSLSHHQHLDVLSPVLTLNSNKHLKDKPDCSVVVCFLCLFLLFVPERALPRYFTGEWGCWHMAGAMLALGLPPLAWAVSHTLLPAPHAAQASPCLSLLLLSPLQERLQGEAVRDAVPGPGRLRSGTWGDPWDLLFGCRDAWMEMWAELQAGMCLQQPKGQFPETSSSQSWEEHLPSGKGERRAVLVAPPG